MGYTTDFDGSFKINKPLDDGTFNLINGLAGTRRMGRRGLAFEYGEEGEFYYDPHSDDYGQENNSNIIDYNRKIYKLSWYSPWPKTKAYRYFQFWIKGRYRSLMVNSHFYFTK